MSAHMWSLRVYMQEFYFKKLAADFLDNVKHFQPDLEGSEVPKYEIFEHKTQVHPGIDFDMHKLGVNPSMRSRSGDQGSPEVWTSFQGCELWQEDVVGD